jgi:translocator protein
MGNPFKPLAASFFLTSKAFKLWLASFTYLRVCWVNMLHMVKVRIGDNSYKRAKNPKSNVNEGWSAMEKMNRLLNVCGLILVLVMNVLADAVPLGGKTTGEISAMFPVKITPAPYAFGIWGLIYILLIVFVLVQYLSSVRQSPEVRGIGPWFWISCLFNASWILLWHSLKINGSVFIMLGLLATLVAVFLGSRPNGWSDKGRIRWFVQVPFSIYLGWISVASLVNIRVAMYNADWTVFGWSDTAWTYVLIGAAAVLAVIIGSRWKDPFYMLVVIWALIAIGVANIGDTPSIAWTAWAVSALLLVLSYSWIPQPGLEKAR